MPLVHVSGFPKEVKLVVSFRRYLDAANLSSKYWITDVADVRNSDMKEITVDFEAFNEALKAEEYVNYVPYCSSNGCEYNLYAKIIDPQKNEEGYPRNHNDYQYQEERNYKDQSVEYSNEGYGSSSRYSPDRARSRSPLEDPSKLDLQIEILKKKRLLIEEEKKLLMEKKKLEMIKEFGINACPEFDDNPSRAMENDQRSRDRILRPQRNVPSGPDRRPRPDHGPRPDQRPLAHIPQFVLPCKIILKQMKTAIKRHAPDLHERNVLTKMISANLRRRFVIILENKAYMNSDAIVRLYRQVHPMSTDEKLISMTLQDVKASHWPKREKSQKALEKMARRKAEKEQLKKKKTGLDGGNKPGTSNDELFYVDVTPDVIKQEKDVKPPIKSLQASVVKTEPLIDLTQVKNDLNTTVTEPVEVDWDANGDDWNDDVE